MRNSICSDRFFRPMFTYYSLIIVSPGLYRRETEFWGQYLQNPGYSFLFVSFLPAYRSWYVRVGQSTVICECTPARIVQAHHSPGTQVLMTSPAARPDRLTTQPKQTRKQWKTNRMILLTKNNEFKANIYTCFSLCLTSGHLNLLLLTCYY